MIIVKGDRVRLLCDFPDGNGDLTKGEQGTVLRQNDHWTTVLWDKSTSAAYCNNDEIMEYFPETWDDDDEWEATSEHSQYEGRIWHVNTRDLEIITPYPPFRKQKRGERKKMYKIAKKIYELDMKWTYRNET